MTAALPCLLTDFVYRQLHGIAFGRGVATEIGYRSAAHPPPIEAWRRRCEKRFGWYAMIEWDRRVGDRRTWYVTNMQDRADIVFLDISFSYETEEITHIHVHRGMAVVPWPAQERRVLVDRVALPEIETTLDDLCFEDDTDDEIQFAYDFDTPFAANAIDAWVACITEIAGRM